MPIVSANQVAPPVIKLNGVTEVPLNYRLWAQKGLVVYGSYRNIPGNRFKCGYQEGINPETGFPNEYTGGYYKVNLNNTLCSIHGKNCPSKDSTNNVRGEWQYHGYDVNGNYLANIAFINDANVTKFNQRDWIKEPWDDRYISSTKLYEGISVYNDYAYDPQGHIVREWIYETVKEWGGVPTIHGTDPEVYKYLYIQSAPTITHSESGRMWHQRPSSIWYQSLSVPVLKNKEQLPVVAEATYVSGTYNKITGTYEITVPEAGSDQITYIDVTVKGTLLDEEFLDEVGRTMKYTRFDIKTWDFTVTLLGNTYGKRSNNT